VFACIFDPRRIDGACQAPQEGPGVVRQLRVGQVQGEANVDLLDAGAPGKTHSHTSVEDYGEPGVREAPWYDGDCLRCRRRAVCLSCMVRVRIPHKRDRFSTHSREGLAPLEAG